MGSARPARSAWGQHASRGATCRVRHRHRVGTACKQGCDLSRTAWIRGEPLQNKDQCVQTKIHACMATRGVRAVRQGRASGPCVRAVRQGRASGPRVRAACQGTRSAHGQHTVSTHARHLIFEGNMSSKSARAIMSHTREPSRNLRGQPRQDAQRRAGRWLVVCSSGASPDQCNAMADDGGDGVARRCVCARARPTSLATETLARTKAATATGSGCRGGGGELGVSRPVLVARSNKKTGPWEPPDAPLKDILLIRVRPRGGRCRGLCHGLCLRRRRGLCRGLCLC